MNGAVPGAVLEDEIVSGIEQSLSLVAPWLPPALCTSGSLARLRTMMARMPRVHRAGFECRLLEGDDQVDVQQGVIRTAAELRAVRRFSARQRSLATGRARDAWQRVDRLCEAWLSADHALSDGIDELWLEFDAVEDVASVDATLVPSVFAVLRARHAGDASTRPALADALAVAGVLLGEADAAALRATMERWDGLLCGIAPRARISHIGVMLGREPAGVRIHLSGVPYLATAGLLQAIGWHGSSDGACDAARALFDFVDETVLCFDLALVAGSVHLMPRLGIEAFFEQRSGLDPRWEPLLHALVAQGLASPGRAAALLRWPGTIAPSPACCWPDDLVVRSLLAPAHHLGLFERRLSHVKISVGHEVQGAKAYFGYGHLWADRGGAPPVAPGAATPAGRPGPARAAPAPARSASDASIAHAIDRATRFLLAARNQGGWWRDFFDIARPTSVGDRVVGYASDEWVTAYVGCVLADGRTTDAVTAARHAWTLLGHRRGDAGGWGYHAQLPPDADSTTWALRLAGALGMTDAPRLARARDFLRAQTTGDGGVSCYRPEDCPSIATFLRMSGPYDGWCAAHTCITAAVAGLSLDPRHREFVRRSQEPDGRWRGHWWDDDEYPTALAATELSRNHGDAGAVSRAARWASARVGAAGAVHSAALGADSAFATALAVRTMVATVPDSMPLEATARAVDWLLGVQQADGGFPASSLLRVPAPAALDPLADPSSTITYLDYGRVFTTATVLSALQAACGRVSAR